MNILIPKKSIYEGASDHIDRSSLNIRLRDGRDLGYAEYGDGAGEALFYFHGSPSSRLEAAVWHNIAKRLNVRIIAVDRPGMGLSTFQPGRRILDFPEDILELADSLNISRFAVIGMSGGAPYVSACAYKLSHRITVAGILSGTGPRVSGTTKNRAVFSTRATEWLSYHIPWLMRLIFVFVRGRLRKKRDLFFWKSLPKPDKAALNTPLVANTWIDSILEAFRSGTEGPVKDLGIIHEPWGFDPGEIFVPIKIWHGKLDRNVPVSAAEYLADKIPDCEAYFFAEAGHFSLWLNQAEEILENMISQPHHAMNKKDRALIISR